MMIKVNDEDVEELFLILCSIPFLGQEQIETYRRPRCVNNVIHQLFEWMEDIDGNEGELWE